ncbi:hypothetical protein FISHEDRAFT_59290, partial [Fistulina hepatica ATCC 64428]
MKNAMVRSHVEHVITYERNLVHWPHSRLRTETSGGAVAQDDLRCDPKGGDDLNQRMQPLGVVSSVLTGYYLRICIAIYTSPRKYRPEGNADIRFEQVDHGYAAYTTFHASRQQKTVHWLLALFRFQGVGVGISLRNKGCEKRFVDAWRRLGWSLFKKDELIEVRCKIAEQQENMVIVIALAS